jgi:hypothetical protein
MKLVVVLAIFLAGCGYVGPVLPPALDIPSQVTGLSAAEVGDQIVAEFTLPALTTEGLPLNSVRSVEVGVGPAANPFSMNAWAASAKLYPVSAKGPGALSKEIPVKEWTGKEIVIAVRATGPKGKVSAWSGPVVLTPQAPLERPTALEAANVEKGVQLRWRSSALKFRIYRATADGKPEQVGESDHVEYLDETTIYKTPYKYFVQAITDDKHLSEISETVSKTPEDTFPPAVPAGLSATAAVGTIELAWVRNTESDFRGYNIYRSVEGGPFERIAELVAAPAYSDNRVESGKKYIYAITSVDLNNNESQRSAPVDATAQ